MSRPTSTEVIDSGKYLEEDFDPMSLTVPHLTAILNYHDIRKPSGGKPKLVQTFKDEIFPRRLEFLEQRREMEASQASAYGISDGMTGEPLEPRAPVRRSTRVSSRANSVEPVPEPPKMKRRRSASEDPVSATKAKRSSNVKAEPSQPTLAEESEPDSDEEPVMNNAARKKPTSSDKKRRVSSKIGSGDDNPWEETNIFQSGNESSSPVRVVKPRASNAARRPTKRASLSAPPESSPTSSPERGMPTTAVFEPKLPTTVSASSPFGPSNSSPLARKPGRDSLAVRQQLFDEPDDTGYEGDLGLSEEQVKAEEYNAQVSSRLAGEVASTSKALVKAQPPARRGVSPFWITLLLMSLLAMTPYKQQSEAIGFCDANTTTNSNLVRLEASRAQAAKRCDAVLTAITNREEVKDQLSKYEFLECLVTPLHLPKPHTCTPCPTHAFCTPHTVQCTKSFMKQEHPLSRFVKLDTILNGMPGFGPVALPPKCIVDTTLKKRIHVIGQDLNKALAAHRGRQLCAGAVGHPGMSKQEEAALYGVPRETLRELLWKKYRQPRKTSSGTIREAPSSDDFWNILRDAIDVLREAGAISVVMDPTGENPTLYSEATEMDLICQAKVYAKETLDEWRKTLSALLFIIATLAFGRQQLANRRIQSSKVSALVATVLDQLRQQEMLHHTDPVTYRQPFLSPMHLRDSILADEHSVAARNSLWKRVEMVVENNTNVRVNVEEIAGDEVRVWRWVGGGNSTFSTPKKEIGA